jgi:hypothetical protein
MPVASTTAEMLFSVLRRLKAYVRLTMKNDRLYQGRIRGGAHPARPPPPKIGKNMIFWCKIVIFHTKHPKNFRASLRSAHFF